MGCFNIFHENPCLLKIAIFGVYLLWYDINHLVTGRDFLISAHSMTHQFIFSLYDFLSFNPADLYFSV